MVVSTRRFEGMDGEGSRLPNGRPVTECSLTSPIFPNCG